MRFLAYVLLVFVTVAVKAQAATSLPAFDGAQQGQLFAMHGSNTVGARLAPELAKDYLLAKGLVNVTINPSQTENEYRIVGYHPSSSRYVTIDVAAHGSSTGFTALADGRADIAMASRSIKDSEVTTLSDFGDMRSFEAEKVVAIDGLAIIVHPGNPVTTLTIDQIAKIFSGEINNWQQLGAGGGQINLYARDDKSGTWDTFKSLVLGKQYKLHPPARRFESNDDISGLVQNDINGIGFVGLASVGGARALAVADNNTRALLPTTLSVATEDYPLSRRLFMYVAPNNPSPFIREFIQFVQSDAGQARATDVGYVAQTPVGLPPKNLDQAQPQYRALVQDGERLSINIRFKNGSADLDNKARQDILRLSQFMKKPEQQGRELLLIGFGDAKQNPRRALVLSKLRAVAVRSALLEHGVSTLPVEGLGDTLPVANNDSSNRFKNQRVEIWLM